MQHRLELVNDLSFVLIISRFDLCSFELTDHDVEYEENVRLSSTQPCDRIAIRRSALT
jgi:hypothetical protein